MRRRMHHMQPTTEGWSLGHTNTHTQVRSEPSAGQGVRSTHLAFGGQHELQHLVPREVHGRSKAVRKRSTSGKGEERGRKQIKSMRHNGRAERPETSRRNKAWNMMTSRVSGLARQGGTAICTHPSRANVAMRPRLTFRRPPSLYSCLKASIVPLYLGFSAPLCSRNKKKEREKEKGGDSKGREEDRA